MLHGILVALVATAVFGSIVMLSDRRLGANIALGFLCLGGALAFVAIRTQPVAWMGPRELAALATGLIAAAVSAALYHFYLGRFTDVWVARGSFAAVTFGFWLVFGLIFMSYF